MAQADPIGRRPDSLLDDDEFAAVLEVELDLSRAETGAVHHDAFRAPIRSPPSQQQQQQLGDWHIFSTGNNRGPSSVHARRAGQQRAAAVAAASEQAVGAAEDEASEQLPPRVYGAVHYNPLSSPDKASWLFVRTCVRAGVSSCLVHAGEWVPTAQHHIPARRNVLQGVGRCSAQATIQPAPGNLPVCVHMPAYAAARPLTHSSVLCGIAVR